jgi:hypothetical protein
LGRGPDSQDSSGGIRSTTFQFQPGRNSRCLDSAHDIGGTPLKVALDQEVRIRKMGQPVHGKVIEPVYAFDKLVVPAGSEVNGKIAQIEAVSKKKRTGAALNADFSP